MCTRTNQTINVTHKLFSITGAELVPPSAKRQEENAALMGYIPLPNIPFKSDEEIANMSEEELNNSIFFYRDTLANKDGTTSERVFLSVKGEAIVYNTAQIEINGKNQQVSFGLYKDDSRGWCGLYLQKDVTNVGVTITANAA